jgi:hypothetical protein
MNQRIKSLSGGGSQGFAGVRIAGQTGCAYPRELGWTAANCNPLCNPAGAEGFRRSAEGATPDFVADAVHPEPGSQAC